MWRWAALCSLRLPSLNREYTEVLTDLCVEAFCPQGAQRGLLAATKLAMIADCRLLIKAFP